MIFKNTFYKDHNDIGYCTEEIPRRVKIIHIVKPALVTTENYSNMNVMIPIEFIDLAKSKLRGEAYKLANEDAIAAKWLNDYNILLETFRAWVTEKASNFGI